jgi:hypothetical protein
VGVAHDTEFRPPVSTRIGLLQYNPAISGPCGVVEVDSCDEVLVEDPAPWVVEVDE